tara:strand:- start:1123 stop:2286 length:1164 start_codon:yes stop_codon:yes gene_type:complete
MNIIVRIISISFPLLVLTDQTSNFLGSLFLLNVSRMLRIILLFLFVVENIRLFKHIKDFYFYKFFLFFSLILFLYVFTDRDPFDGFWHFSKTFFWVSGINIFYAYLKLNIIDIERIFLIVKRTIFPCLFFTFLFIYTGYIKEDYNVAAYLLVNFTPILLYWSNNFKKNNGLIILNAIGIILTLKRGAILAFFASIIVYAFVNIKKLSFKTLIIIFINFSIISMSLMIGSDRNDFERRYSIEQFDPRNPDSGGGRMLKYITMTEDWYNSSNRIFGFGNQEDSYRSPDPYRRTHAHSDIFGFLYNHGLVGLMLIFYLYIKTLLFYFKVRKLDSHLASIILSFLVILVLVNFYSGLFKTTETLFLFLVLSVVQFLHEENSKQSDYYFKSS